MNYMQVRGCDIANGPGIRTTLFVSGCPYHCKGCFNPESWPYDAGQLYTEDTFKEIWKDLEKPGRTGFSLLGGEPLCKANRHECALLLKKLRILFPLLNIWVYTGSTYESLLSEGDEDIEDIFSIIDVLVDGPFIQEKKNLMLKFRGSSNQRIIDMCQTRVKGTVILHTLNN